MKKIFNILLMLVFALAFASCEPHESSSTSLGCPISKDQIKVDIVKDTENSNLINFRLETPQCIGLFTCVDAGIQASGTEFSQLIAWKGDYELEVKVYNQAGLSESIEIPFSVDTDIYSTYLTGGENPTDSKIWRIDGNVAGHIGCGPEGGTWNEWWTPAPNSLDSALYDDELIFSNAGNELELKNYGASMMNESTGSLFPDGDTENSFVTQHYTPATDATWELYQDKKTGENWLRMNKAFPAYAVNPAALQSGQYKISSLTETKMHIVYAHGGNSWHYFLTADSKK